MLWSLDAVCPGRDRRALTEPAACWTLDSSPAKGCATASLCRRTTLGGRDRWWPDASDPHDECGGHRADAGSAAPPHPCLGAANSGRQADDRLHRPRRPARRHHPQCRSPAWPFPITSNAFRPRPGRTCGCSKTTGPCRSHAVTVRWPSRNSPALIRWSSTPASAPPRASQLGWDRVDPKGAPFGLRWIPRRHVLV